MTEPVDVECPICGVQPGNPCLGTDGRRLGRPHARRRPRQRAYRPGHEPVTVPDPQSVRCPSSSCQARPGLPCIAPDGRTTHPHRQRWTAAILRHADGPDRTGTGNHPGTATERPSDAQRAATGHTEHRS